MYQKSEATVYNGSSTDHDSKVLVTNLTKSFGELIVLDDISFEVIKG